MKATLNKSHVVSLSFLLNYVNPLSWWAGACFSKVPKLSGRISGGTILFVSWKRCSCNKFYSLYNIFSTLWSKSIPLIQTYISCIYSILVSLAKILPYKLHTKWNTILGDFFNFAQAGPKRLWTFSSLISHETVFCLFFGFTLILLEARLSSHAL